MVWKRTKSERPSGLAAESNYLVKNVFEKLHCDSTTLTT